jgi:hypothetical protein
MALAVALGVLPASAQEGSPTQFDNQNAVSVELEYTVESGTIAAGVAAGEVTAYRISPEELEALGFDSDAAVEYADILNDVDTIPDFLGLVYDESGNYFIATNDYFGSLSATTSNEILRLYQESIRGGRVEYGGQRWVDGYFNEDINRTQSGLGGSVLESSEVVTPRGFLTHAPIISKSQGNYLPGFVQTSWQNIQYSEFTSSDFLPTLTSNSSSSVPRFLVRIWNTYLIPALDSFLASSSALLLWVRRFVMLTSLYLVGRRLVIFCMRTGPAMINCVVNVLTNGALKDDIKVDE